MPGVLPIMHKEAHACIKIFVHYLCFFLSKNSCRHLSLQSFYCLLIVLHFNLQKKWIALYLKNIYIILSPRIQMFFEQLATHVTFVNFIVEHLFPIVSLDLFDCLSKRAEDYKPTKHLSLEQLPRKREYNIS